MSMEIPERAERKYEPYTEYKDSGVEWLGEIPDGWDVKKLKYVGQAILGLTYQPSDVVDESQGTLVLRSSNIQNGCLSMQDNVYVKTLIPKKLITRIGDILICSRNGSRDLIGKNAKIIPSVVGETFGAFMTVFRSEICDYLYYVFNSQLFNYELGAFQTSTINQLTLNSLNSFQVPLPSIEEQNAIIDFLDHETARIDEMIARKQRLIGLLQEQRIALITHVVTKGLNPDAPMKDSGVEWLGEIPAHWEVKKLKYISSVRFSSVDKHSKEDEQSVYLCNYTDVYNNDTILPTQEFMEATATKNEIALFSLKEEDVIVTKDSEDWKDIAVPGYVAVNLPNVICGYHLALIRPYSLVITGRYLFWSFCARNLNHQFVIASTGITRFGLGKYWLDNSLFFIPPIQEQQAITDYLDKETSRINDLVGRIIQAIEKLQEYRSALITAAVTGKIDVRQQVS